MDTNYFAGCNYWTNNGENEFQPKDTATSMHDCGECEKLDSCKLKKETEVWEINDEIRKQMDADWNEVK